MRGVSVSKKNRQEFSQARNQQSDKAAFIAAASQYKRRSPPQTPEQIAQTERAQRTAQEQSAAQAVRDWPGSLAERRDFWQLWGRPLTNEVNGETTPRVLAHSNRLLSTGTRLANHRIRERLCNYHEGRRP